MIIVNFVGGTNRRAGKRDRKRTSPVILVQVCIGHSAAGSCWNSRRGWELGMCVVYLFTNDDQLQFRHCAVSTSVTQHFGGTFGPIIDPW